MSGVMPGKRRQDGQKKVKWRVQWSENGLVEMVRQEKDEKTILVSRSWSCLCNYARLISSSITPTFTGTSPRGKSWTQIMKVGDAICVAEFHDLCPLSAARKTLVSRTVKLFHSKGVTPIEGAKWEGGGQNLRFLANKSLYLSSGAR